MKKHINYTYLNSLLIFIFFLGKAHLIGQQVTQLTSAEATLGDYNSEMLFLINGEGCYASFIDDRVQIKNLDNSNLLYESSFKLCEKEIINWKLSGEEIYYVSYYSVFVENIISGSLEEYPFNSNLNEDQGGTSINLSLSYDILGIRIYPGSQRIDFDIKNKIFLGNNIFSYSYQTENYSYFLQSISGDRRIVKQDRITSELDTLLYIISSSGDRIINQPNRYFFATNGDIISIGQNDDISIYSFNHGTISSGVETSTGKLICSEIFSEGSIIYTLDRNSLILEQTDTLKNESKINILDSKEDRLFIEFYTQFESSYGYMDTPYENVNIFLGETESFSKHYVSSSPPLFIVEHYRSGLIRNLTIYEKESDEVIDLTIKTSKYYLDDPIEVLNTPNGIRFFISEGTGKVIYTYNTQSNDLEPINRLSPKLGLGINVEKEGNNYLLIDDHSLERSFEYINSETYNIERHEVDGIIHGRVLAYGNKFFYIRNQDFETIDEDYILDFVMFDPISAELEIIEENFIYDQDNVSFSNINFSNKKIPFGFTSIYNTPFVFDLNKNQSLITSNETKTLLKNIYHESDEYYFSNDDNTNPRHYKINKSNINSTEFIFSERISRILPYKDNSYFAVHTDGIIHFNNGNVSNINVPSGFISNRSGLFEDRLILIGVSNDKIVVKQINLLDNTEVTTPIDGFPIAYVGNNVISLTDFEFPYDEISTNLITGEVKVNSPQNVRSIIHYTSTEMYFLDRSTQSIDIVNTSWEILETIDASILKNGTIRRISDFNQNPVLYRLQKPILSNQYVNLPAYSLVLLDTETNEIEEFFNCESEYRFEKAFNIDSVSIMLLRTEEEGFQICQVEIPNFNSTNIVEEDTEQVITISPNPTSGIVTFDRSISKIQMYNSNGKLINQFSNQKVIDLSENAPGLYFIHFLLNDQTTIIQKVIKL